MCFTISCTMMRPALKFLFTCNCHFDVCSECVCIHTFSFTYSTSILFLGHNELFMCPIVLIAAAT